MKPLLGMCVLGRPKSTEACIKSILARLDRSKFYWGVLDQDAVPEVKEVVHRYKKDIDIVWENDFNNGIVFGHNQLMSLRKPKQTYIKWDDDCIVESEDTLDLLLKAVGYSDIGSALAIRPTFWIDAPGRKDFFYHDVTIEERDKDFWIEISKDNQGVVGCVWALKGEMLDDLGYFNEDLCCDDLDMPIRIGQLGLKNVYLPDAVIKQNAYQEKNLHPRHWIAKALYSKNVEKSRHYNILYKNNIMLRLGSRFGDWFDADPGYKTASNKNWEFCEHGME